MIREKTTREKSKFPNQPIKELPLLGREKECKKRQQTKQQTQKKLLCPKAGTAT